MLSEIYGDRFDPKVVGKGRIFVLGQHNSGTSITTRLLMLLGAYQGSSKYIVISKNNKLKFFENTICDRLNELVLDAIGDPHYSGYHAQGLDFNRLKSSLRIKFKVRSYVPVSGGKYVIAETSARSACKSLVLILRQRMCTIKVSDT